MGSDGEKPYEGWCWPRNSIWIDFMNPKAREYLSSLYVNRPKEIEAG
jgi:alpha 1,3-glucosidase